MRQFYDRFMKNPAPPCSLALGSWRGNLARISWSSHPHYQPAYPAQTWKTARKAGKSTLFRQDIKGHALN
ncbi:hypothetical protein DAQ1742_03255 [Dickeya aquatica]|uniref:Uncharacterized protein n=1 Tax=Dickeya aquatica TaxID=1401087 RepID=A0A375ADA7_9GAMM|nr:hypothetical protein DAQ1742_03255 [Dickeya aquatica]